MSERNDGTAQDHGQHLHAHVAPTTQQIRIVGQRRREAEEKLAHHLEEARHRNDQHHAAREREVDGGDIAAIQNDDRLTAADRVDMIANQVMLEPGAKQGP